MSKKIKELFQKTSLLKILGTLLSLLILISIMLYDVPYNYSWSAWTLPLSGQIFVIDPGHGGYDGGAKSKEGIHEKDITLSIAKNLQDYLNEAGALVIMTRETDKDLAYSKAKGFSSKKQEDLQNRINLANESMADFFISIHLNSIPAERWHGAQTFYYPVREENKKMAEYIQGELIRNLQNTDRQPLPRNDLMILKYVNMPSTMVEVGFLSNPQEAKLLSNEKYQKSIAFAIYQGMLNYYSDDEHSKYKNE